MRPRDRRGQVRFPPLQVSDQAADVAVGIDEVRGGERALKAETAKSQSRRRRQGSAAAGGKGTRLLGEGEDQLAAELVLVVPEADVDRVEWAKQLDSRGPKNSARSFRTSRLGKTPNAFIRGSASHCQCRRGNGKGFSLGDRRDSPKPTRARDRGIHQNALAVS